MTSQMADTIVFRKVLEGLIHNVNTPLNLILGYVQHLQKKHPELEYLDKIFDAGLQIDDLLNQTHRNVLHRLILQKSSFELDSWLKDELDFLHNDLSIKHQTDISYIPSDTALKVETSYLLLCVVFEQIIFKLLAAAQGQVLSLKVKILPEERSLQVLIPHANKSLSQTIEELITGLQNPLMIMEYSNVDANDHFAFHQVRTDGMPGIGIRIY